MATVTKPENGTTALSVKHSVIRRMADRYGMTETNFQETMFATVWDPKGSKGEFLAFLSVAEHYGLNPLLKEIYGFAKKGGGIQPIVPVDGWANIINSHAAFDGMEFRDHLADDGTLEAITCTMFRKDRSHPISCTEYMNECVGNSDPWRRWPRRMLRHKAMIQAARYAFSLSGIMDPDEAERAESVGWGKEPQGKVGVSAVNKLLESMPAHKPTTAHEDAEEGVDDAPDDNGNQTATFALDAILDAMAACKTKQELDTKYAAWQVTLPDGVETPLEAESRYAELRESLPEGAKAKQKNLMGE